MTLEQIEEVAEALLKQTVMKPSKSWYGTLGLAHCPECKCNVIAYANYCHNCGQKLDWGETDG